MNQRRKINDSSTKATRDKEESSQRILYAVNFFFKIDNKPILQNTLSFTCRKFLVYLCKSPAD